MPMIYVRAKPDRAAFFEGKAIPSDKFIPVTDTPYIRRLAHHWEDIEVQGGAEKVKSKAKPAAKAAAETAPYKNN